MDEINKFTNNIEAELGEIHDEIEKIQEKGFVYARAKNIRKAAQAIKQHAQDLRVVTTEEFKRVKK